MNIKQAKQIRVETFLERIGCVRTKTNANEIWFRSPLHEDKTPSFRVNQILNTWFDYGLDEGGDLIKLVQKINSVSVSEALSILASTVDVITSTPRPIIEKTQAQIQIPQMPETPKERKLEILEVTSIHEKALFYYLQERCIDLDVAKKYLKQVDFRIVETDRTGNRQYALAMKNNNDCYEFRNKHLKGIVGEPKNEQSKDLTTFNVVENKQVSIFEGMFDFLSFLTHYGIKDFQSGVIILHSITMSKKAQEILKNNNFSEVFLFLDNDEAGRRASIKLSEMVTCPVKDKSTIYRGFKDYNEFLQNLNFAERKEKRIGSC